MKFSTVFLLAIPALLSSLVLAQDQSFTELIPFASLHRATTCNFAHDCHHHLRHNTHYVCRNHECRTACDSGFRWRDGRCERDHHHSHHHHHHCHVADCHQPIPNNSHRICSSNGKCAFQCNDGHQFNGQHCVKKAGCRVTECYNTIPAHSHRTCKHDACSFGCETGYHREGDHCAKDRDTCTADSQCLRHRPAHSAVKCRNGKCVLTCYNGYQFTDDNKECVPNVTTCGVTPCQKIAHGQVKCSGGKCVYTCDRGAGWTLFFSGTTPKCINLAKDPDNCGKYGHVCPPDYLHHGKPKCANGHCKLDCPGGQREHNSPHAPPYCS